MKLKRSIKQIKTDQLIRTKFITFITMIYNFLWSVAKILFGLYQASFLYCLSGIYTLLIGFSKKIFISNHSKTAESINKESKSVIMGVLILIAGLTFGIYMGRLFFSPQDYFYSLISSILVALCSFIELGIAIYHLCKIRKKNDILLSSLRLCNLVSAIFALVLTQVAILSATGANDTAYFNGVTGVIAGLSAVGIGIYIIIHSAYLDKEKKKQTQQQSIQKHQEDLNYEESIFENIDYENTSHEEENSDENKHKIYDKQDDNVNNSNNNEVGINNDNDSNNLNNNKNNPKNTKNTNHNNVNNTDNNNNNNVDTNSEKSLQHNFDANFDVNIESNTNFTSNNKDDYNG